MQPILCPHCGAPPPTPINPTAGQFSYMCPYCKRESLQGQAPPPPPPQQHVPAIIVVRGPSHHDEDSVSQQVAYHHNAAYKMSWIVWLVVVLTASLGGGGVAFSKCSKHSSLMSSLVWDGSEPFTCSGNDEIAVQGVEANFAAGTAISAAGNCHFRCTDCTISAPTGIEATGNAQVTIINGSVKATKLLADASGNARVNIGGNVTVTGRTTRSGNAQVSAPDPAPPPATATAAASAAPAPTTPAPVATTTAAKPAATPAATHVATPAATAPKAAPSASSKTPTKVRAQSF